MNSFIGIWIVRREAQKIGQRLATELGAQLYLPQSEKPQSNREAFAAAWQQHRQWILIGTTGIAVRYLQGLPQDKTTDPALVVLDEAGRFAVSLLGGHEGGANRLAYQVANCTGAVPVITTATETLKPLVLGIGCRKGISSDVIDEAVQRALNSISRDFRDVREVATVDLKAQEPGLLAWCAEHDLPLRVISLELLKRRPWVTEPSAWVRENIGVDGVCEPCALLATFRGKLIAPKLAHEGVTVAVVEEGAMA